MTQSREKTKYYFIPGKDIPTEAASGTFERFAETMESSFKGTALINGGEFTQRETSAIKSFLRQVAKISQEVSIRTGAPEVFNPGTKTHFLLTGRYMRMLARKCGLNEDQAESQGLLHDVGRIFTHRLHTNDLIGMLLMKRAGVNEEFLGHFFDETSFMPAYVYVEKINKDTGEKEQVFAGIIDDEKTKEKYLQIPQLTKHDPYKLIGVVSDNLGKYYQGRLIRWDDFFAQGVLPSTPKPPDKHIMRPSEYLQYSSEYKHPKEIKKVYDELRILAEKQLGTSLNTVVNDMETDLQVTPLEII